MTVLVTTQVSLRRFSGFQEPGLPAGFWFATASALGDATGGVNSIRFLFQVAGSPAPSLMWSLDQLNTHTTGVEPSVRLQVANMDQVPGSLDLGAVYNIRQDGVVFGAQIRDARALVPLFLGQPIDNDFNSGLVFDITNVAAQTLTAKVQGYYWTPGAINSVGGPRRPPDGLYGV